MTLGLLDFLLLLLLLCHIPRLPAPPAASPVASPATLLVSHSSPCWGCKIFLPPVTSSSSSYSSGRFSCCSRKSSVPTAMAAPISDSWIPNWWGSLVAGRDMVGIDGSRIGPCQTQITTSNIHKIRYQQTSVPHWNGAPNANDSPHPKQLP